MTGPLFADTAGESPLRLPDPADRDDLRTFLRRALGMDDAAVVRLVDIGDDRLRAWIRTPFGPLASRVLAGSVTGGDRVAGADHLLTALDVLPRGDRDGRVDPGPPLTSAWTGLLPPAAGFRRVDSVPAQVLLDLTAGGREAARDSGPAGLPPSLLDQVALEVSADTDDDGAGAEVDMRAVFALTGCGFVPSREGRAPEGEPVHVSVRGPWVRLDARYGSVHRRPESLSLDAQPTEGPSPQGPPTADR